jgi:hypothetical protein
MWRRTLPADGETRGVRGRMTLNVLNMASALKRKSTASKMKASSEKLEPAPEDPESAPGEDAPARDASKHPFVRLGKSVFQAVKSRVRGSRGSKETQRRGSYDSAEAEDHGAGGELESVRSSLKMSEGEGELWNSLDVTDVPKHNPHALDDKSDEWEYENPLIPRFEPEPAVEKIDKEYARMELEKLDQTLKRVYPKLQFAQEKTPELELKETIQSMMPKTLRLNGQLSSMRPMPVHPGDGVRAVVPRLVVVTGHKGVGGNVGLNGVYERHTDNFCSRPVYQKFLEKHRDNSLAEPPGSPKSQASSPKGNGQQRLDLRDLPPLTIGRAGGIVYNQTAAYMKAPKAKANSSSAIGTAQEVWFLYFMDAQGRWCIGPFVGSPEAYARCPGSGETVPDGLVGWEVWDMGLKYWRRQNRMQAVKGGY